MRWLLVLLASGCTTTELDATELDTGDLTAAELAGGAIGVQGGDVWSRRVGCPSPDPSTCLDEVRFWIDLRIRNDAYDKRAGVVWIDTVRDDPAAPWHVATAAYEATRADGLEIWGVDATVRVIGGNEPRPRIRFAAFVEMAGQTHWDDNGGADHVID